MIIKSPKSWARLWSRNQQICRVGEVERRLSGGKTHLGLKSEAFVILFYVPWKTERERAYHNRSSLMLLMGAGLCVWIRVV